MGNEIFDIPKNRYYELKYHCLQYSYWKYILSSGKYTDETNESAQKAIYEVEKAVQDVNCNFGPMLLDCVTKGLSFKKMQELYLMIPSKEEFYDAYHKFFYFLNRIHGI